jgi:hypothetical protein
MMMMMVSFLVQFVLHKSDYTASTRTLGSIYDSLIFWWPRWWWQGFVLFEPFISLVLWMGLDKTVTCITVTTVTVRDILRFRRRIRFVTAADDIVCRRRRRSSIIFVVVVATTAAAVIVVVVWLTIIIRHGFLWHKNTRCGVLCHKSAIYIYTPGKKNL